MLKTSASLTALLLAAMLAGTPALAATETAHDGHGAADLVLSLDDGQKWQTDAPLRAAMETIRNAVAPVAAGDAASSAEYGALAAAVQSQVDYMIENCELPPEADAQLHVLLGQVIEGAEQLAGDEPEVGMTAVAGALEAYDAHFVHDGWEPLTH
ncbi:MAG TPA: hypothetical protein PLX43_01130 [Nitrobacter sp.]|nr:hypothetical protein [Nitrobacter sp.]